MWLVKVLKPFVDFLESLHRGVYRKQIDKVANVIGMGVWIMLIPAVLFFAVPFIGACLICALIGLFVMRYYKMKEGRV